jgi:hypothetical protein
MEPNTNPTTITSRHGSVGLLDVIVVGGGLGGSNDDPLGRLACGADYAAGDAKGRCKTCVRWGVVLY